MGSRECPNAVVRFDNLHKEDVRLVKSSAYKRTMAAWLVLGAPVPAADSSHSHPPASLLLICWGHLRDCASVWPRWAFCGPIGCTTAPVTVRPSRPSLGPHLVQRLLCRGAVEKRQRCIKDNEAENGPQLGSLCSGKHCVRILGTGNSAGHIHMYVCLGRGIMRLCDCVCRVIILFYFFLHLQRDMFSQLWDGSFSSMVEHWVNLGLSPIVRYSHMLVCIVCIAGNAVLSGSSTVVTFDGRLYTFRSDCSYLLAADLLNDRWDSTHRSPAE